MTRRVILLTMTLVLLLSLCGIVLQNCDHTIIS